MRETNELRVAREILARTKEGANALAAIEKAWDEECRGAGLYPESLFHFTDKRGLLGILESNFKIKYSLEKIECHPTHEREAPTVADPEKLPINRTFGAPMVSFCDLRLSELRVHMRDYGSYGIGMSKRWAIDSRLNPVYYVSSHAELLEQYIKSMSHLFELIDGDGMNDTYHRLLNFYRYLKNYEAPLYRKDKLIRSKHRFANEREWRFVPSIINDWVPFVSEATMKDSRAKEQMNSRFENQPLMFEPKDINYVIVETEEERDEIIRHIARAKGKYPKAEQTRLMSRIITSVQIHQDV